ncbi:MAG TPA: diguanylate cyclase [Anaerolineales bacterium]|nr:diguanylate cyclase [Anaerolineales bacterium]
MKVLLLASNLKQRALLQGALEQDKHVVFSAPDVGQALTILEAESPRLVILDEDIGAEPRSALMARLRAGDRPHVHVLSITSTIETLLDSDDAMRKPFTLAELKSRVALAQRMLALGDSLHEARQQIDRMALFDPLTGLMNRPAFLQTARGELERARRASAPFSVISMDVDGYSDLNATYGFAAGDQALKAVAQTIRERSRPYDLIGRWAGDEIMEALPGVIGEDAEKIAMRIIKGVLSSDIVYEGQALTVGMSAGIAAILQINASAEVGPLIDQARAARVRAREIGGNQALLVFP